MSLEMSGRLRENENDKESAKNEVELEEVNMNFEGGANLRNEEVFEINSQRNDQVIADKSELGESNKDNKEQNPDEAEVVVFEEKPAYEAERVMFIKRNKRIGVFILIITINIIANLDDGTIPAATDAIQKKIGISDNMVGLLGTLIYTGNLFGSFLAIPIINRFRSRKWVLAGLLYSNFLFQVTFFGVPYFEYLVVNRLFVGITQSFIMIYSPIWVDQYAPRNRKTLFMAIQQVASPLGVVLGYALTYGCQTLIKTENDDGYGYSYVIQSLLLLSLAIGTSFVPEIWFFTNIKLVNTERVLEEMTEEEKIALEEAKKKAEEMEKDLSPEEIAKLEDKKRKEEETPEGSYDEDDISIYYDYTDEDTTEYPTFFKYMGSMCKQPVFMVLVFAGTVLFFIVTVIQFWISDYLKKVMKVRADLIFASFVVTCVTAPVLGIVLGGWIVQKCGGYEGKHSVTFVLAFGTFSSIVGWFITNIDTLEGFAPCLWLYLFIGGGLVPNLVGIVCASLPQDLKAPGISFKLVLDNMFGFLPAPYIYGQIFETTKDTTPKLAMSLAFYYTSFGAVLILIGTILRYRDFNKREKEEMMKKEDFMKRKLFESNENDDQPGKKTENAELINNNLRNREEADFVPREEEERREEKPEVSANVEFNYGMQYQLLAEKSPQRVDNSRKNENANENERSKLNQDNFEEDSESKKDQNKEALNRSEVIIPNKESRMTIDLDIKDSDLVRMYNTVKHQSVLKRHEAEIIAPK